MVHSDRASRGKNGVALKAAEQPIRHQRGSGNHQNFETVL